MNVQGRRGYTDKVTTFSLDDLLFTGLEYPKRIDMKRKTRQAFAASFFYGERNEENSSTGS
jgi:hypothetical protein